MDSPSFCITRELRNFVTNFDRTNLPSAPVLIFPINLGPIFAKYVEQVAMDFGLKTLRVKDGDREIVAVYYKEIFSNSEGTIGENGIQITKQDKPDEEEGKLDEEESQLEEDELGEEEAEMNKENEFCGENILKGKLKEQGDDIKESSVIVLKSEENVNRLLGQTTTKKVSGREASTSEICTGQAYADQPFDSQVVAGQVLTGEAGAGQASLSQALAGEAPTDNTPTDQAPTDQVPTDEVPTGEVDPSSRSRDRYTKRYRNKFTQTEDQEGALHQNASQESNSDYNVPDIREKLGHIIELHRFPPSFTSNSFLNIYVKEPRYVKWCDGRHVILITGSAKQANEFLRIRHRLVKSRPITRASEIALTMAEKYPPAGRIKSMSWSRSWQTIEDSSEEKD